MCLATIDQYLATSFYRRWQQWNNIKLAYCLCTASFIFAILHGVPSIIYYNYTDSSIADTLVCRGALPIFITVLFESLAYRNVKQLAYRTVPLVHRELDKQLTSMVLVQIVYIFIAIVSYTVVIIITTNLDLKDKPILAAELQLTEYLGAIIYYSYFAAPFYMYVCVSKRFRQQLIYVFFRIYTNCCRKPAIINNQIAPATDMN
ncbi:unnamed protein product [Rotaria sp. Silwood2]|nr:unnamed protein product [Rotaria sp. Silwood2]CAF4165439.1 unnamed protein product [Rotaria sp. Silwood2]CAF4392815.1 unnamed protein product [Rotaria sp. Silwood2]